MDGGPLPRWGRSASRPWGPPPCPPRPVPGSSEELVPSFPTGGAYDSTTRTGLRSPAPPWIVRTTEGVWDPGRVVSITNPGRNRCRDGGPGIPASRRWAGGPPWGACGRSRWTAPPGWVSLDLETVPPGTLRAWDLRLDGYTMRREPRCQRAPGRAGAARVLQTSTRSPTPGVPPSVLRGDSFGGVFNGPTEEALVPLQTSRKTTRSGPPTTST